MANHSGKVLFIGFGRSYSNRTLAVLLRAIQHYYYVDFFGPGYQSDEVLSAGLERWTEASGPYDLVVFEHYTIMHDYISRKKKPFGREVIYFSEKQYARYAPLYTKFIEKYAGAKLFLVNWDVYGIDRKRTEHLESLNAYIADCTQAKLTIEERQSAFPNHGNQAALTKGFLYGASTDHWVSFVRRNRNRVLEIPHTIGLDQFSYIPIASRTTRLVIPGARYPERRLLYDTLPMNQRLRKAFTRIGDRYYFERNRSLSEKRLLHIFLRYDSEIRSSKFAFVSGSTYRVPVRKYLEIPALGAVPIGQTMEGFTELGFKNNHNFLIAETPTEVLHRLAECDDERAQTIANNARSLILNNHSEPARAKQLASSFQKIMSGEFKGSYWSNGRYLNR